MSNAAAAKPPAHGASRAAGSSKLARRNTPAKRTPLSKARFDAVMQAAAQSGLLGDKSSRISGRVSPALLQQAKRQTGVDSDTDLIAFALANVALEDNFVEAFRKSRGKVDPILKLGF